MRLINCSCCFKNYPPKYTKVIAGKRVCRECISKESKEQDFSVK